jgi:hypothetical protein
MDRIAIPDSIASAVPVEPDARRPASKAPQEKRLKSKVRVEQEDEIPSEPEAGHELDELA